VVVGFSFCGIVQASDIMDVFDISIDIFAAAATSF